jgi:hypothetical protein
VIYTSQFVLLSLHLWPWYCLSFVTWPVAMILSVFCHLLFGHDIVCLLSLHLWSCYCLSFVTSPVAMMLSVFCHLPFGHDIVCLLSLHLWSWYCLSFLMYGFWLPLWYLQTFLALLRNWHMPVNCFLK